MRYFLVTFPIHLRRRWRRVLRFFGVNTYAMIMDDVHDRQLLLKMDIGFALLPALRKMIKDLADNG